MTGDWQQLGRDGVGVVRAGYWYLRSHLEAGPSTYHYPFGRPSDRPVAGDWDGDGDATSGIAVSDIVVGGGFSTLITTGDNQYEDGRRTAFEAAYDPSYGRVRSITRPVPGNHGYRDEGAAGYFDYFGTRAGTRGQGWYSFDVGAWHVVALNSNRAHIGGCQAGSPQERWLGADLAERRPGCTLATLHHPRWSSGRHGGSAAVAPLYDALSDAEADVVVAGHDHDYERFAPQDTAGAADDGGLRQFVVGTGGKNIRPFATVQPHSERRIGEHGVLELTLRTDSYDWRFLDVDGAVLDAGTGRCVR